MQKKEAPAAAEPNIETGLSPEDTQNFQEARLATDKAKPLVQSETNIFSAQENSHVTSPTVDTLLTSRPDTVAPSKKPLAVSKRSSKLSSPFTVFVLLALITAGGAGFWYFNPFPKAKQSIQSLVHTTSSKRIDNLTLAESSLTVSFVRDNPQAHDSTHEWNYYLQLSAWARLKDAERTASEYRKKSLPMKVTCSFNVQKRMPVYRVRCGPFPSRTTLEVFRQTHLAIITTDAFVDSIRTEQDPSALKVVPTLELPAKGYAIKISTFREKISANQRAFEIAKQYAVPVFLNIQTISQNTWYRIYVGPYTSKDGAERQAEFLSSFMHDTVHAVELSKEQ